MDEQSGLLLLITAAAVGVVATIEILRKQQRALHEGAAPPESQYAVSTEGMKRCPSCNTGNLVTDATCSTCGKPLPG